jgi:hypothetical protein
MRELETGRLLFGRQNKELNAKLVELATSQRTTTKAAVPRCREISICKKSDADSLKEWLIAAAAADCWDRAVLTRVQVDNQDVGQILQEVEAGRRPEWKDITDGRPIYKFTGPNGTP